MIASRTGQDTLRRAIPNHLPDLPPSVCRRAITFTQTRNRHRPILGTNPSVLLPPRKLVLGILEIPETDPRVFTCRYKHALTRGMRSPGGIQNRCRVTTDEGNQVREFGGERCLTRGCGGRVEGRGGGEDGECAAAGDLPVDRDEFL